MNNFIKNHPWLFTLFVAGPILYVPAVAVGVVVGAIKKASK